jgi:hypothetical protein
VDTLDAAVGAIPNTHTSKRAINQLRMQSGALTESKVRCVSQMSQKYFGILHATPGVEIAHLRENIRAGSIAHPLRPSDQCPLSGCFV